jgi:SAM-dependent methyltransferase
VIQATRPPTTSSTSAPAGPSPAHAGPSPAHAEPSLAHADRAEVEAYYRTIAPFYDAEQADRDDLDFWRSVGERHRGAAILELGAGSGRVTAILAPLARSLVGIDVSPELLRLARSRLEGWPRAHLLQADMRALPLRGPFDLIVAANDPLSHLVEPAERDRVLSAVARLLAPGGRFILDALWLAPGEAAAVARAGGRVRRHTASVAGDRVQVVERWERRADVDHCCLAHYEYHRDGCRPVVADFAAHDWSIPELFERLARAGLGVAQLWGSYRRAPWRPNSASQLIVEATLA